METQPAPIRIRPTTRATVASSPASTASRRSGPYGLDADRTNAQAAVAPAEAVQRYVGQLGGVVVLDEQHVGVAGEHRAQLGGAARR